jgi:hypothetical protein
MRHCLLCFNGIIRRNVAKPTDGRASVTPVTCNGPRTCDRKTVARNAVMVWLALFGIDRDFNPVARRDVRGGRMDFLRLLDLAWFAAAYESRT